MPFHHVMQILLSNHMNKLIFNCFIAYFLLFSFLFVHAKELSCNQTPYPHVCDHYIGTTNTLSTIDSSSFHDIAIKVTMNQAIEAYKLVSTMDLNNFKDNRAKSAWEDCVELYEDTIYQLNRSINSNNLNDKLTWQSASITNHQTCQNGFIDFNLPSHLNYFPSMLTNFTKLLSNSLSISNTLASSTLSSLSSSSLLNTKQNGGRRLLSDKFPHWLSGSDRKLLQTTASADIVVAQDGSGDYKTISEGVAAASKLSGRGRVVIHVKAGVYKEKIDIQRTLKNLMIFGDGMDATVVAAAKGSGKGRVVIHVKAGVYKESVDIKKTVKNIMIFGDGMDSTIVTGNHNAQDGATTFRSATFAVMGDGFIAKDMTFENTAGPQKYQAVALRSGADYSVFYRCSFKGYQDTLYVYANRQFYRDCNIYGTVDFIFGNAVTVLQNCNIFIRKPMGNQQNSVTAQARTDPNENTGIVIHNCRITADGDLKPSQNSVKSYLGRPWQRYSRTVVMKSNIDGVINSQGWAPWSGGFALSTLYYGEYMNVGDGANTDGRVNWPGFHVITNPSEAGKFSVGNFLAGESWISGSGVPFDAGL